MSEIDLSAHTVTKEFVIHNEHGLHARPASVLVSVIKKYTSTIIVTNLDGTGHPASGRSLMKVIALGVKKGHRLKFEATGSDAQQAIEAIGKEIAAGLGE